MRAYDRAGSPSYVSPPMTAQPIATVSVYTRNGRRVRRLPFLKEKYHVCCLGFSRLQSAYTRIFSYQSDAFFSLCGSLPAHCPNYISRVNFPVAAVRTPVVSILPAVKFERLHRPGPCSRKRFSVLKLWEGVRGGLSRKFSPSVPASVTFRL